MASSRPPVKSVPVDMALCTRVGAIDFEKKQLYISIVICDGK